MGVLLMNLVPVIEASQEWAGDHAAPVPWVSIFGYVGAGLFALLFAWVFIRGLMQSGIYRATEALGEAERGELADEIARAEERTVGEIAVVVLGRSDRHPGAEWLAATVALLLGSVLLAGWLPWGRPLWLLVCQFALGGAGFAAARFVPGFRRAFVSDARADEMAREQALQEFYGCGLHRTEARTGVLLFVSLLERRAIVLGDEGIDAKLDTSHWKATDDAVLGGMRRGELKQGLHEGIERCADVLAEHFPRTSADRDEVPNHVIVRAE